MTSLEVEVIKPHDRFRGYSGMYHLYAEVVSRRPKTKIQLSEDEAIHNLIELARCYGEEDTQIDTTLFALANEILYSAFNKFKTGQAEQAFRKLRELEQFRDAYGSHVAKEFINFHVCRIYAYGHCRANAWTKAVRVANMAVSRCPLVNGVRALGLVDLLILMSDAYSALKRFDDAVNSAKLAVDVTHDIVDAQKDQLPRPRDPRSPLGPLLNSSNILAITYFNLATQLRNSDMTEASVGWYERALQAAENSKLDDTLISALQNALLDAHGSSHDTRVIPTGGRSSPAGRHTPPIVAKDRSGSHAQPTGRQSQTQVHGGQAQTHTSQSPSEFLPPIHSPRVPDHSPSSRPTQPAMSLPSEMDREVMLRHAPSSLSSLDIPVRREAHQQSQVNASPHEEPACDTSERTGRPHSPTNQSPSECSHIPSLQPLDNSALKRPQNATRSKRTPSKPSSGKYDHTDEMSYITYEDEEVAFVTSASRQRPKSAVSKLGGNYDGSGSPTRDHQRKAATFSSVPTSPEKNLQRSPQSNHLSPSIDELFDHNDGPAKCSVEKLASIRESLVQKLKNVLHYRSQIEQRKCALAECKHMVDTSKRHQDLAAVRRERSNEVKMLLEMSFERQCNRLYESILRAQCQRINYGVPNSGEEYFEGMIVDVKRSSKANSDRDRCVIIRCRVNGTFDAEVISNGELIINIHPSLIRVPPPPDAILLDQPTDKGVVEHVFAESDRVQVLSLNGMKYFTGYIEKVYNKGSYKIEYLDGSYEDNVALNRLRPCTGEEYCQSASFEQTTPLVVHNPVRGSHSVSGPLVDRPLPIEEYYVGQQVLMRFLHGNKWRLGTVMHVRGKGEAYDVLLSGRMEVEKGVPSSCVRSLSSTLYGYGADYILGKMSVPSSPTQLSPPTSSQQHSSSGRLRSTSAGDGNPRIPLRSPSPPIAGLRTRAHTSGNILADTRYSSHASTSNIQRIHRGRLPRRHMHDEGITVVSDKSSATSHLGAGDQESTLQHSQSAVALREKYAQEMHRGAAALNSTATERKLLRVIRNEKIRMNSAVKIQAVVRGYLARAKVKIRIALRRREIALEQDEGTCHQAEVDLLNLYAQALSLAFDVSRQQEALVQTSFLSQRSPDVRNQLAGESVKDMNSKEHEIQQMRNELVQMHENQLKEHQKQLTGVLERELKGLGKEVTSAVITAVKRSSSEEDPEIVDDEGAYADNPQIDVPSVDVMKNMYLEVWGNCTFEPTETVSIVASATTEFAVLDATVDKELLPAVYTQHAADTFSDIHTAIFTKSVAEDDLFYILKIRLSNNSSKPRKLKFPCAKISEICETRKNANVTLNEQTKFTIGATSLRLDALGECLSGLWDAHVAWASQKILTSASLMEVLQELTRLYLYGEHDLGDTSNVGWVSERFSLLSDLRSLIDQSQQMRAEYDTTVTALKSKLCDLVLRWGVFPSPNQNPVPDCSQFVSATSNSLMDLSGKVMEPFRQFLTHYGSVEDSYRNYSVFRENLHRAYGGHATVHPLLLSLYRKFTQSIRVETSCGDLILSVLMQLGHQSLVKGFAHADLYPWDRWFKHNADWTVLFRENQSIENIDAATILSNTSEVLALAEGYAFSAPNEEPIEKDGADSLRVISALEKFISSSFCN